jgi:DNA-binding Lrp family transcriptional regulator
MMPAEPIPDRTDLRLLEILQDDFPLISRPWDVIAGRLGITPEEVTVRLQTLQEARIVLGIAPVLESRHMGLHATTLVALRVPEERIQDIAGIISAYPEVSHNYRRDHPYAIWFTVSAQTPEHLYRVLADIRERTGIPDADILNLPTVRKLKIDLRFPFSPSDASGAG